MKQTFISVFGALCLMLSGVANAAAGDPELVAGTYSCTASISPNPNPNSQANSMSGTPFDQEFSFSCRGPVPVDCSIAAAKVASSLATSDCVNATSVFTSGFPNLPRTITQVTFVCEGIRKHVLDAVADSCKSMFQ